ncbi:MAG: DUF3108 domain-containing protein [Pyrinomonadaceae bacterium]
MNSRIKIIYAPIGLVLLLALGAGVAHAQKTIRVSEPRPFEPSEELVYEAEFSRALLRRMDVADFHFTAARTPLIQNSKTAATAARENTVPYTLTFVGDITSKGFFSKLFNWRFRQRLESTVDPASFTVQNTKKLDEQGKRVRTSEAVFDKSNGKVTWTELDPRNPSREPRTVSSQFTGQVQDLLTAVYYLRTQPLQTGKTLELSVSDSGQVYRVPIRVVEKKRMKTVLGRVGVTRLDAGLFGLDGMIRREGALSIWLTDDWRRIPVSARIKSEFGTFDIKLKKVVHSPSRQEYLTKR